MEILQSETLLHPFPQLVLPPAEEIISHSGLKQLEAALNSSREFISSLIEKQVHAISLHRHYPAVIDLEEV